MPYRIKSIVLKCTEEGNKCKLEKPKVFGVELFPEHNVFGNCREVFVTKGNIVMYSVPENSKMKKDEMRWKCTVNSSENFTMQPERGGDAERQSNLRMFIRGCNTEANNIIVSEENEQKKMKIVLINVATSSRMGSRHVSWGEFLGTDHSAEFVEIKRNPDAGKVVPISNEAKMPSSSELNLSMKQILDQFQTEVGQDIIECLEYDQKIVTAQSAKLCLQTIEKCSHVLRNFFSQL